MTEIKKEETKISVITNNGTKKKRLSINLRTLNKVIFVLIALASISYISIANDLTAQGFVLRDMKKKIKAMENENASLETRITSLSAYNGLGEKVKSLGMVTVDRIRYIETSDSAVAKK